MTDMLTVQFLIEKLDDDRLQLKLLPFDNERDHEIFVKWIATELRQILEEFNGDETIADVRADLDEFVPNPKLLN